MLYPTLSLARRADIAVAQGNALGEESSTNTRALKGRDNIAMPQSLSQILVHLVFSTKDRKPLLKSTTIGELKPYLGGILNNLNCNPIEINAVEDHAHLLFALSRTASLASVVSELKSGSTKWIKSKWLMEFAWQGGYGAFSVSISKVDAVSQYIRNQEEHHKEKSFQDELRGLLREHGISFDEKYLWD